MKLDKKYADKVKKDLGSHSVIILAVNKEKVEVQSEISCDGKTLVTIIESVEELRNKLLRQGVEKALKTLTERLKK